MFLEHTNWGFRFGFVILGFVMLGLFADSFAFGGGLAVPKRGFVSSQAGETWEQGLISGNGTIGANIRGVPLDETIVFTHERMFLPQGKPVVPPDTAARLPEVRALIDKGKYKEATQLAFDLSGQNSFMYPDPFVPAFDLRIQMEAEGKVTDYMRSVDFQTGEATVHWADDRGIFERRLFVSRSDGVAVLQITGPKKGSVDCRMHMAPRRPSPKLNPKKLERSAARFKAMTTGLKTTADKSSLTFRNSFTKAYAGSIQSLEGVARVDAPGAAVSTRGSTMIVTGADRVLVLIAIDPIYKADSSRIKATKKKLGEITADYPALLKRHARLHGKLFNRVRLDIGGGADHQLTSEALLAKTSDEDLCEALVEKTFDAGRYNIICATGELPPTLQGVWGGTYVPSWASDFTQNGNVPSAIAAMLMGNTPEQMLAYTSYIESIVPGMRVNAKNIFGARGIVLPSRTTTNGYNNALAPGFAGGMWVGGAPWAAHFFYDYYLYTGDRKFLAEHALPFMQETALFFEDYLYEGPDGKYIFNPTTSPENSPKNTRSQGTFNATMDIAATKELLHNAIAASKELGVNQKKIPVWEKMLTKMPDYMISKDGVVKEWTTPKLEDNLGHRHSSHLYALYDGMPEEIAGDPKLRAAFRKIVETKLENHYKRAGFMSFGVVQLGQAATSLGEGELAYQSLIRLVNSYWLHNLASMHNNKSLFNMDVSGGMPAVIIKMLVASDPGRLQLLPALPKAWPSGTIEGVLCRGQIEIKSLKWTPGKITVTLLSAKKQTIGLETPVDVSEYNVTKGKASVGKTRQKNVLTVKLPKQQAVTIEIVTK